MKKIDPMEKPTVVIVVEGGMVVGVYANTDIQYVLVDRDNIEQGDDFPDIHDLYEPDGTFTNLEKQLNELKET